MAKPLHPNMKIVPRARREKLSAKQILTVEKYSSPVKLKSVLRWKPRMAAGGFKLKDVAEKAKKVSFRISEWISLTHEPSESNFCEVESAIFELETKK